ncbi:MAG: hypothetical protein MHM6MM_000543 [Cercozoa sp. M6MM]
MSLGRSSLLSGRQSPVSSPLPRRPQILRSPSRPRGGSKAAAAAATPAPLVPAPVPVPSSLFSAESDLSVTAAAPLTGVTEPRAQLPTQTRPRSMRPASPLKSELDQRDSPRGQSEENYSPRGCAVCGGSTDDCEDQTVTVQIRERSGSTRNVHLHAACFVCNDPGCHKSLLGERFLLPPASKQESARTQQLQVYCEPHWQQRYSPRCHRCQRLILDSRHPRVNDMHFHRACFTCVAEDCDDSLEQFVIADDKLYCSKHAPNARICTACTLPCSDYYDMGKGIVICVNCFLCERCGKGETDSDKERFLTLTRGKEQTPIVYCASCFRCACCHDSLFSDLSQGVVGRYRWLRKRTWCEKCYQKAVSARCASCGEVIERQQKCCLWRESRYHEACLQCTRCHHSLIEREFGSIGGLLYCRQCESLALVNASACDVACDVCGRSFTRQQLRSQEDDVICLCGRRVHKACARCAFCHADSVQTLRNNDLCCSLCAQLPSSQLARRPATRITPFNLRVSPPPVTPPGLRSSRSVGNTPVSSRTRSRTRAASAARSSTSARPVHRRKLSEWSALGDMSPLAQDGTRIRWRRGELIGKGAAGKVFLAMDEDTGELLAVKQLPLRSGDAQRALQTELALMQRLRHPNIVKLYGFESTSRKLFIIMEYVAGRSLSEMIKSFGRLSESSAQAFTHQLLKAVAFLHEHHIVHRDIKPQNLLINTEGDLKLADFGSAKQLMDILSSEAPSVGFAYTPIYVAPEVLRGDHRYDRRVDVWSVGCCVLEMLSGRPPWWQQDFQNPLTALYHIGQTEKAPKLSDEYRTELSREALDFLDKCLELRPAQRPDAATLLQHPWMTSFDKEMREDAERLRSASASHRTGSGTPSASPLHSIAESQSSSASTDSRSSVESPARGFRRERESAVR